MGYTVTTGKKVFAVAKPSSKVMYFLYEKTHESNVRPKAPTWSCIGVGHQEDVVRLVIRMSGDCDNGSLKSSSSDIKSENYIAAWMRELKNPMAMPDIKIDLKKGTGFHSTLPERLCEQLKPRLDAMGLSSVLEAACSESGWEGQLYDNLELVHELFAHRDGIPYISPYLQFCNMPDSESKSCLGIQDIKNDIEKHSFKVSYISDSHKTKSFFVSTDGGDFKMIGPCYSAIYDYIRNYVIDAELLCTGSFKPMITGFKELIKNASELPAETIVTVDATKIELIETSENAKKWQLSNFEELKKSLGIIDGDLIEFKLGDLSDVYKLKCLNNDLISIKR